MARKHLEVVAGGAARRSPAKERAEVLELDDGATVRVAGGAMELCDPAGRLLVRYRDGAAEIVAASGDLTLSAPEGRIVLRSGRDVAIEAEGDLALRSARRVEIGAGDAAPQIAIDEATAEVTTARLSVKTRSAELTTAEATLLADRIATTAASLTQTVERYELTAARLFERTRDAYREASGLMQAQAGRARTIVKDVYALYSRRTSMESTEETRVDGKKILLG
jgi:uncharacterized protein (DUF2345 family)